MAALAEPKRHAPPSQRNVILSVRGITVAFGQKVVLENLDLDVYQGEILGFVGGSGTGKSVLMRTILGLNEKRAGTVSVQGRDLATLNSKERATVDSSWGVLFQQGALFSSLTVRENIQVPMREHLRLSQRLMDDLARLKIELVGLQPDAVEQMLAGSGPK